MKTMNEMNWTLTMTNVNSIMKKSILQWFNKFKYNQQIQADSV